MAGTIIRSHGWPCATRRGQATVWVIRRRINKHLSGAFQVLNLTRRCFAPWQCGHRRASAMWGSGCRVGEVSVHDHGQGDAQFIGHGVQAPVPGP